MSPDQGPVQPTVLTAEQVIDRLTEGLPIRSALIETELDLGRAWDHAIELEDCEIRAPVKLAGGTFPEGVSFRNVVFAGDADFQGASFGASFAMRECQFGSAGVVSFNDARFEKLFLTERLQVEGPLSFERTVFESDVWLQDAHAQSVTFDAIHCKGSLLLDRASFGAGAIEPDTVAVRLTDCQIEGRIAANELVAFEGGVVATRTNVAGSVVFDRARVSRLVLEHGQFGQLWLAEARAQGSVIARNCRIDGPLVLRALEVNRSSTDRSDDACGLSLDGTSVGGNAWLDDVHIAGQGDEHPAMNGVGLRIGGQLSAVDATFYATVVLDELSTGLGAFFHGAKFHGPVSFNRAHFESEAHFRGTDFKAGATLHDVVARYLSFAGEELDARGLKRLPARGASLDLKGVSANHVDLRGVKVVRLVDLTNARLVAGLSLGDAEIPRLLMSHAMIGGVLDLTRLTGCKFADLSHTTLGSLDLHGNEPVSQLPAEWNLSWCSYRSVGLPQDGFERMFERSDGRCRQVPFATQPFVHLANALRSAGAPREARDVQIQKHAFDSSRRRGLTRLWHGLWRLSANYGYSHVRPVFGWLSCVALAAIILCRPNAFEVPPHLDSTAHDCSSVEPATAAVYSISRTFPSPLPEGTACQPLHYFDRDRRGVDIVMQPVFASLLIKVAGWFFLPLIVLTWTGFLRRLDT